MAVFHGTPSNDLSVGANWSDMFGNAGNDKLNDTGDDAGVLDHIWGYEGHDYLYFSGSATGVISGAAGNDFVKGFAGADSLGGGSGNDVVIGSGGDDKIEGDDGSDLLLGGDGNDTIDGGYGDDGAPIDVVAASATTYQNNVLANYGDAGIYGGNGDDVLYGNLGNDRVDGEAGNDEAFGDLGNDELYGGEGNDRLDGDRGSDHIYGGPGRDVMRGFKNADVFHFQSISDSMKGKKADLIVDFNGKRDIIDLKVIDAKEGGGDNHFKFIGKEPFTGKKGELHYKGPSAHFKVTGDTDGDGKADFMILVDGSANLRANDFEL